MCEKCKKLLNVPKDKKAETVLFDVPAHDAEYFHGFMMVNHEDDGTPYAIIKQDVRIESTGRCYGMPIFIKYCPFCGEKLY